MLFVDSKVNTEDLNKINNFFAEYDKEIETVDVEATEIETPVSKYISSLVCGQYQKSVEEISNTQVGSKRIRKRTLQQVMQESFFSGANRFGNNFIA